MFDWCQLVIGGGEVTYLVCLVGLFLVADHEVHLVEQNGRVFCQSGENEEDAGQHPGLYGCQALSLRGVGRHVIEDVHQNQEQGY